MSKSPDLSITKYKLFESITSSLLLGFLIFSTLYSYKGGLSGKLEIGVFIVITVLSITITIISSLARAKFSDFKWLGIYALCINVTVFLKNFNLSFFPKNQLAIVILGGVNSDGAFSFIVIPIFIILLTLLITNYILKVIKNYSELSWMKATLNILISLKFNLFFSISLSLIYSLLTLLSHHSFKTHVYDFGIFDQAIFMLSRFRIPASTTRQFTNLFYDHQHFSLITLTPLYWLNKGFNGNLLIFLTPFLLITFPSIILHRAFYQISKFKINLAQNLEEQKFYWIIGLTSFLLWQHPFTQSAVAFFFHEKYLFPLFFSSLVYFIIKFIIKPKLIYLYLTVLFNLLWLATKEYQWIFAFVFWLQLAVLFYIAIKFSWWKKTQEVIKKYIILLSSNSLLSLLYGVFFLRWFTSQNQYANDYSNIYSPTISAIKNFLQTGNFLQLIENLQLFQDVNKYLYQNFLVYDLIGFFALPLNIAGNYAQRALASGYSFKNPIFHYGVDVPIYTVVGVLVIYLYLLFKQKNKLALGYIVFTFFIYIFGFMSLLGWNRVFYLYPKSPNIIREYIQSSSERKNFWIIVKKIPPEASLVSSPNYATHLTARTKVANYPVLHDFPDDYPGKNHLETFEYWLLPKHLEGDKGQLYRDKIDELKTNNYSTIEENSYQILLKK